jgi:hypothetical protein
MMQRKKLFTKADDEELLQLVKQFGENKWTTVSQQMSRGFTTRQCRDRWRNYLNPNLDQTSWTDTDDTDLIDAYNQIGNRWSSITALFPGRSCSFVRNRCLAVLRRNARLAEAERQVTIPKNSVFPGGQSLPLIDGSKLPPDEEEIIDIFLGRTLEGWEVCERGDSEEWMEMNEKSVKLINLK